MIRLALRSRQIGPWLLAHLSLLSRSRYSVFVLFLCTQNVCNKMCPSNPTHCFCCPNTSEHRWYHSTLITCPSRLTNVEEVKPPTVWIMNDATNSYWCTPASLLFILPECSSKGVGQQNITHITWLCCNGLLTSSIGSVQLHGKPVKGRKIAFCDLSVLPNSSVMERMVVETALCLPPFSSIEQRVSEGRVCFVRLENSLPPPVSLLSHYIYQEAGSPPIVSSRLSVETLCLFTQRRSVCALFLWHIWQRKREGA